MVLPVGTIVPDFTLPSTSGKDFTLSNHATGKMCIIYIYPNDFTPICTTEACAFRDTFDFFSELDINVYGISTDPIATHLKFKEAYNLPYELLSDIDNSVIRQFGVIAPLEKFTSAMNFTKRVTFLLNHDHKVISVFQNSFFPKKNIKKLIENIKELQQSK